MNQCAGFFGLGMILGVATGMAIGVFICRRIWQTEYRLMRTISLSLEAERNLLADELRRRVRHVDSVAERN